MNIFEESILYHEKHGGKLSVQSKVPLENKHDLSLAYTPGVAAVCQEIAKTPKRAYDLTIKKNTVAIVSDGSAVLGLGNIGPLAALPVMEGKAVLFKSYADIDAFPICIETQDTQEIIDLVRNIAPSFGGINLEDIAAPKCFEIELALQDLGIPVFHDDQHGTSITLLAALINAAKLANKNLHDLRVVINGAGAAGTAITELLLCIGHDPNTCTPVKDIIVCDTKGIISAKREDILSNPTKLKLAAITNKQHQCGTLADALKNADVFVGVSVANVVTSEMIKTMADKPLIFAMANPIPEIMPDEAKKAGAFIVGTGRSDFSNQINNVLVFPGIFRGAMDAHAPHITNKMKLAAAFALANTLENPTIDKIIPDVFDTNVVKNVASAVKNAYLNP
ncbi:MAG: NADP-dependent malic enzyme [Candidatus Margulisbacteria bacterium]|nr:NADP-dependent malic enzyme [Candidatus Margulisiibacteriota bacterium]